MIHPIKYIRSLITPPCSECANSNQVVLITFCNSEKYKKHAEKVKGTRPLLVNNTCVRGTRFCTFVRKENEEE